MAGVNEGQGGFLDRGGETDSVGCLFDSFEGSLKNVFCPGLALINADSDIISINEYRLSGRVCRTRWILRMARFNDVGDRTPPEGRLSVGEKLHRAYDRRFVW